MIIKEHMHRGFHMNIVEVNFADAVGHIFNGYDLHLALRQRGFEAGQIVMDKRSNSDSVKSLSKDLVLHHQIREFEKVHSISNLLYPYGEEIVHCKEFLRADIVHYHILHNGMVSLLDYPRLMNAKKSVWTIHDPWIITGNCVHPLSCDRWKKGCGECKRINEIYFELSADNTDFMWEQKRRILAQVNPHIVVASNFMKWYLQKSPITEHFSDIHVIPFGVKIEKYAHANRVKRERKLQVIGNNNKFVIGFRADQADIKGNKYVYEALRKVSPGTQVQLICVGNGKVPGDIRNMYQTTELGWVDDEQEVMDFYQACDLFLMPSLAESFGMMAVEAMASECAVICFKNTVLEEVTNAPECGIAVEYLSSDALAAEIVRLAEHPDEALRRGRKGFEYVEAHYNFDTYVDRHIELYEEILKHKEV